MKTEPTFMRENKYIVKTMNKLILIFLILISFNEFSYSQTKIVTEEKTFDYKEGREVFNICKVNPSFTFKDSSDYYWFNEYSGIKNTKGGCGGQLLHGKYQRFNENGTLIEETNYYMGLEDGLSRTWGDNGEIKETYKYKKGVLIYAKFKSDDGYIIEWIGELFKKGSIKNTFTSSGKLIETSTFIGPFFSHTKLYFEDTYNQQIQAEFTAGISGDFFYDSYKSYFKNGKIKVSGKYSHYNKAEGMGFKDSIWTFYDENGGIVETLKYKIFKENYPNGNIKSKGSKYFNNNTSEWIKDGYWLLNKEDGTLDTIEEYEYGKQIKYENGKRIN